MNIGDNIKRLRKQSGLTQEQLADKVDVVRSTVTQWESGWSQPRMGKIQALAKIFHVDPSEIVSDFSSENLSISNSNVINSLNSNIQNSTFNSAPNQSNLDLDALSGSTPITNDILQKHPNSFVLYMTDDHMSKSIPPGYDVIIDPDEEAKSGQIVVVREKNTGDITLRRYIRTGSKTILISESTTSYPDITLPDDSIDIMGTVVKAQRQFKR